MWVIRSDALEVCPFAWVLIGMVTSNIIATERRENFPVLGIPVLFGAQQRRKRCGLRFDRQLAPEMNTELAHCLLNRLTRHLNRSNAQLILVPRQPMLALRTLFLRRRTQCILKFWVPRSLKRLRSVLELRRCQTLPLIH